jgi:hypothetical protein
MPMPRNRVAACVRCRRVRRVTGRELCTTCHSWCSRHDTLADYERRTRPVAETAAEYRHLHDRCGLPPEQVAARLGLKRDSLYRALYRYQGRQTQRIGGAQ